MSVAPITAAPPDRVPVTRALLSVSDKTGLVDLARALAARGVELISTGGTAKAIAAAGLAVKDVSEVTGFPEIMDGRVKTLHPKIHGGLLGVRADAAHAAAMAEHGIDGIDLLVVNLYPFQETAAKTDDWATAIENIDIGGPAMIRAAAKNHGYVAVVVHPRQYAPLLVALDAEAGCTTLALRKKLALDAFGLTATYDAAVSNWLADRLGEPNPRYRAIGGERVEVMRYGENPHQLAAFYRTDEARPGVASAAQAQGKQLSYNNVNDTDAAYELVAEFDPARAAASAIIKHANPCGVAEGATLTEAYLKALRCDPVSAFGGIVAFNRTLDADAAREVVKIFTEVIIAPDATEEAKAIVAEKKNLRLLLAGGLPKPNDMGLTIRTVAGGFLAQTRDFGTMDDVDLVVKTFRTPTAREEADLVFAFRVVKHVKSNAIVFVKDGATVGIGAGQMSRVDAARIAVRKAGEATRTAGLAESLTIGSVAASDAFFPFADGLETIIEAGATAVVQPGGSMRDDEVITAADEAGIAMAFTGMRHFRH